MSKNKYNRKKSGCWYQAQSDEALSKLLCSHVERLRTDELQTWRTEALRRMRLYAGGFSVNGTSTTMPGRTRFNLIRSAVDTGVSIMSAARTLPYIQTRGADWWKRRRAMLATRTLQTQFQQIGVFTQSLHVVLDALVIGLGACKFYEDVDNEAGGAACERVLPMSLVWDPTEAVMGLPRTMYQVSLFNRDVLAEMCPDVPRKVIDSAPGPDARDQDDFQIERGAGANQCIVVEAWKLPSGSQAKDGLHVLAVPGYCLVKEEWKKPRFPFGFLRGWEPNQLGLPGCSITELCEEAQLRIEEISEFVRECQILGSRPFVLLPKGGAVEPDQLDNSPMQILRYDPVSGARPEMMVFSATPTDLQEQYAMIREEKLTELGFSAQQVAGEKPSGINSGAGLRAQEDISSKRHVAMLRHLEQYYQDCAQALIDVNNDVAEAKPSFAVDRNERNRWLDTSKWKDVSFETGEAQVAVLPVSALIGSVSAQFDTTQQWVENGWCDMQTAKQLQAFPDTEGQLEDDTEDEQYARWVLDQVLDGTDGDGQRVAKRVALDPHANLEVFAVIARVEYLKAKRLGADKSVLAELRRLLDYCRQTQSKVKAAVQPQAAVAPPALPPPPADIGPVSPIAAAGGMAPGGPPPMLA